jgi:hypothetical protein
MIPSCILISTISDKKKRSNASGILINIRITFISQDILWIAISILNDGGYYKMMLEFRIIIIRLDGQPEMEARIQVNQNRMTMSHGCVRLVIITFF